MVSTLSGGSAAAAESMPLSPGRGDLQEWMEQSALSHVTTPARRGLQVWPIGPLPTSRHSVFGHTLTSTSRKLQYKPINC